VWDTVRFARRLIEQISFVALVLFVVILQDIGSIAPPFAFLLLTKQWTSTSCQKYVTPTRGECWRFDPPMAIIEMGVLVAVAKTPGSILLRVYVVLMNERVLQRGSVC